jgi:A/G-specific adenine glycosylase
VVVPGPLTPFQAALLGWANAGSAGGGLRDLPWRRTRDAWAVLVSEVMLQQTQVARVAPVFERFLARFATPADCAAAPIAAIVRAWSGLGYNRRAVNLHRAAAAVVDRHGGAVPTELGALLALPGVGPYTARAVLAFSVEADGVGVLDTNSARVLARALAGRRLSRAEAQAGADAAVPPGRTWRWNSAMLDLGATVCLTGAPRCGVCPVAPHCSWRAAGGPDPAVGSAGTSGRQSAFAGSDRQGRGRLVAALRAGPLSLGDPAAVAAAAGWPDDPARADRVVAGLVRDGLVVVDGTRLSLPSGAG